MLLLNYHLVNCQRALAGDVFNLLIFLSLAVQNLTHSSSLSVSDDSK